MPLLNVGNPIHSTITTTGTEQVLTDWYPGEEQTEDREMDVNKTPLSKIFKYHSIAEINSSTIQQKHETLASIMKQGSVKVRAVSDLITRNTSVFVGVEVEIEGVGHHVATGYLNEVEEKALSCLQSVWAVTNDDSLRNSGQEFVTRPGLQAKDLPNALALLEMYLRGYVGKAHTNYRCGTHVHVDVRNLMVGQYVNMVMLYTIFEDLFYKVSGDRYKNIFCVPLRASARVLEPMMRVVLHNQRPTYDDFRHATRGFKKYQAFNMLPTVSNSPHHDAPLGTIEFRHHRGTSSPTELSRWVQMILDIHKAAQILPLGEIKELIFGLNERENYIQFASKVFGEPPSLPNYGRKELIDDMYRGSAFLKEVYINSKG